MAAQRFAVYVRRSAKDELREGERETSTQQQLRECLAYASRRGWTVPKQHIYDEGSGVSASDYGNGSRTKFDTLLAACERRDVDGLLIWKVDRATRNSKDTARLAELHDDGLPIVSVVEGDAAGEQIEWLGMLAKKFVKDISVNSRRGKESLALKGLPSGGGPRRYGFEGPVRDEQGNIINRDRVGIAHVPEEADRLQEAGRRVLAGEGINTVCRDFNRRGYRMADGVSLWQPTALRRLLLQPRTAGLRQQLVCRRKEKKGGHRHGEGCRAITGKAVWPAIIDEPTWTRLRAVLMDPTRRKGGHPVQRMLSGLPTCRTCRKGTFHGRLKDGRPSYVCSSKSIGCFSRIDGTGMDEYVRRAAVDWLCGPGLVKARQQLAKGEAEHDVVKAQLAVDEAKLMELADAYAANDIDMPSMLRARQPIEQRITRARQKLDQVPRLAVVADLPNTKRKLTSAWKRMSVTQQRSILRAIVDRLEVGPGTPGRHGFDESRVLLTFIDREQPNRQAGWKLGQDASFRRRVKQQAHQLPHETDPATLDSVARAMTEEQKP